MKKLTTFEFVGRAIKKHGYKYDYSLVAYKNKTTKVKIICPIHGVFEQRPLDHLRYGCNMCGSVRAGLLKSSSRDEFIKKAVLKHGDKYDYSFVKYLNNKKKVKIICKIHGEFWQTPNNHLYNGCPFCKGKYEKKYAKLNIPRYKSFYNDFSSVGIYCRRNKNDKNILEVKCHLCGKWFIPTYESARTKRYCISGGGAGECNLYCSKKCKNNCSTFRRHKFFDWQKPINEHEAAGFYDNSLLKTWSKQVKVNANNECEICGSLIELVAHHIEPKSIAPEKALNTDNGICLCKKCHIELHKNINGCGFSQLRKCEVE